MIAQLSGKLATKTPTASVIDCSGVGYEVLHTPFTAESLKTEQVTLYVHTHVREDQLQLFGFSSTEERALFRELLKVSNVGPKLALSIMSGLAYRELLDALGRKDVSRLQQIPGIGKKTADRLLVEMSDRVSKLALEFAVPANAPDSGSRFYELESVLLNLGYQRTEISRVVKTLRARSSDFEQQPLETMVKTTLKELTQVKSV